MKSITDSRFNTLYHMPDPKYKFVIMRWVDNKELLMVTTMHAPAATARKTRKHPRETAINKARVRSVWGENHEVTISIPLIINDYNQWMGGVDRADQLIAYY